MRHAVAPRPASLLALLCLGLLISGCGGEPPAREPAAASTIPADTVSAGPSAPASAVPMDTTAADPVPAAAAPPAPIASRQDTAVVRSLTDGDRGCYVVLEDERGDSFDRIAPFDLCERQELVAKRVRLTLGPSEVMADSCEGNPECTERQTVEVLKAMEEIP